jgi:hypothetical protein
MTEKFQKLVDYNIQLLPIPEIESHFVFERDGFAALVERINNDFGRVGTAGLLNANGVAPLVWRGSDAFFIARNFEQRATGEQVERLRAFQKDLTAALTPVP